jgi:hypothetical protein
MLVRHRIEWQGNWIERFVLPWGWVLILFLAQVEFWWWYRELETANLGYFVFLFLLVSPALLFFLSVLILPDVTIPDELQEPNPPANAAGVSSHPQAAPNHSTIRLIDHYFRHRQLFFSLAGLVPLVNALLHACIPGEIRWPVGVLVFQLIFTVVLWSLAICGKKGCHIALAIVFLILLIFFILLFDRNT